MTVAIEHNLKFVTELNENHPTAKRLLALPEEARVQMLESMLRDLVGPAVLPRLNELNKGNTYAKLVVCL
jgi:hypothetical protein